MIIEMKIFFSFIVFSNNNFFVRFARIFSKMYRLFGFFAKNVRIVLIFSENVRILLGFFSKSFGHPEVKKKPCEV